MDNKNTNQSNQKTKRDNKHTAMRMPKTIVAETKKFLTRANKKEYGSTIKIEHILADYYSMDKDEAIKRLQENSLTEEDKFKRDYRDYCSKNGNVPIEEFFKLVRQGVIFNSSEME